MDLAARRRTEAILGSVDGPGGSSAGGRQDNGEPTLEKGVERVEEDDDNRAVLLALIAAFTAIQWSRAAMYYLVDFGGSGDPSLFMNVDLGFDEAVYGTISTVAFAAPFTLGSLAAGSLIDHSRNRPRVVALATAGVGAAMVAQALAPSAAWLAAARAAQGAAASVVAPAAYSILASTVRAERLSEANSRFTAGIYAGGALASLSALLDERLGWRATSLVVAAVALAAAAAVALVVPVDCPPPAVGLSPSLTASYSSSFSSSPPLPPPPSSSSSSSSTPPALLPPPSAPSPQALPNQGPVAAAPLAPLAQAAGLIVGDRTLRLVFCASMVRFAAGFTILAWLAPWARGAFPGDAGRFAVANALVKSGGGFAATVAGASLCAALTRARGPAADALVPAAGSALAAGLWYILLHQGAPPGGGGGGGGGSPEAAAVLLLAAYLVAENWLGPTVALLQRGVPAEARGATLGLFGAATQVAKKRKRMNLLETRIACSRPGDLKCLVCAPILTGPLRWWETRRRPWSAGSREVACPSVTLLPSSSAPATSRRPPSLAPLHCPSKRPPRKKWASNATSGLVAVIAEQSFFSYY